MIKKFLKNKSSSLLWIILAIVTLITAYSNYQNDRLVMSCLGLVITIACFVLYLRERKKNINDEK